MSAYHRTSADDITRQRSRLWDRWVTWAENGETAASVWLTSGRTSARPAAKTGKTGKTGSLQSQTPNTQREGRIWGCLLFILHICSLETAGRSLTLMLTLTSAGGKWVFLHGHVDTWTRGQWQGRLARFVQVTVQVDQHRESSSTRPRLVLA